jgi:hypothetical protein
MRKTQFFLRVSFMLLALWGVLFAGCSNSSDDGPPQAQPVKPISGIQVYNADGSNYTGTIASFPNVTDGENVDATLSDLGLIDAEVKVTSGNLTLNLGTKSVTAAKLVDMAGYGLTVTPPNARFYQIDSFKDGSNNELKLLKVVSGEVKEGASFFYATEDANISGGDVSINFKKGWNWLLNRKTDNDDVSYTGDPAALGFKWYINFP